MINHKWGVRNLMDLTHKLPYSYKTPTSVTIESFMNSMHLWFQSFPSIRYQFMSCSSFSFIQWIDSTITIVELYPSYEAWQHLNYHTHVWNWSHSLKVIFFLFNTVYINHVFAKKWCGWMWTRDFIFQFFIFIFWVHWHCQLHFYSDLNVI